MSAEWGTSAAVPWDAYLHGEAVRFHAQEVALSELVADMERVSVQLSGACAARDSKALAGFERTIASMRCSTLQRELSAILDNIRDLAGTP